MEAMSEVLQNISPNVTDKTAGKKRKLSTSSCDDDQPAEKYLELAEVFTLDRFCDEILFEIFKHLDTFTLLALEKTCTRFFGIVQDHHFWNDIDVIEKEMPVTILRHTLKRAHKKTKSIKINGLLGAPRRSNCNEQKQCLLKHVMPKCEHLSDLELENVFIDFMAVKIHDFPKNLKRMVFRNVSVRWPDNSPTIFQKMDTHLIWLEELCVEACTWFHPYDIMLFSKCPSLKRLSLRGCQNLLDFVPYGSMASRFGFPVLESLDIRDTPITDSDLQCFNALLTLKELLLQCPIHLRDPPAEDKSTPSTSATTQPDTYSVSSPEVSDEDSDYSAVSDTLDTRDNEPSTSKNQNDSSNVMMTIDLQNHMRTVILHGRVCEFSEPSIKRRSTPDTRRNCLEQLIRHPHFSGLVDRQSTRHYLQYPSTKPQICPLSDRGICCFGRPVHPIDQNIIWIRIGNRPSNNTFERLSMRHYKRITDASLQHLVQCSPNLAYLDVSWSCVTQKGIDEFKVLKPWCVVVSEHLEN